MTGIRKATASAVAALFLIPATTALGAEPAANADPAALAAAPSGDEQGVEAVAVGQQQEQAQPAPAPVVPAAKPAQDDVSGGNEYTEDAPPTAPAPEPETPTTDDPDEPAPTQAPSSSGGSAPTATTAAETAATTASDGLPRTGAEGVFIALIGLALVSCGTLIRRAAARLN